MCRKPDSFSRKEDVLSLNKPNFSWNEGNFSLKTLIFSLKKGVVQRVTCLCGVRLKHLPPLETRGRK